jgi:hypothetical protein
MSLRAAGSSLRLIETPQTVKPVTNQRELRLNFLFYFCRYSGGFPLAHPQRSVRNGGEG